MILLAWWKWTLRQFPAFSVVRCCLLCNGFAASLKRSMLGWGSCYHRRARWRVTRLKSSRLPFMHSTRAISSFWSILQICFEIVSGVFGSQIVHKAFIGMRSNLSNSSEYLLLFLGSRRTLSTQTEISAPEYIAANMMAWRKGFPLLTGAIPRPALATFTATNSFSAENKIATIYIANYLYNTKARGIFYWFFAIFSTKMLKKSNI